MLCQQACKNTHHTMVSVVSEVPVVPLVSERMLEKCKADVFSKSSSQVNATYYIADGSGLLICSGNVIKVDGEEGQEEQLPWTLYIYTYISSAITNTPQEYGFTVCRGYQVSLYSGEDNTCAGNGLAGKGPASKAESAVEGKQHGKVDYLTWN